MSTAHKIVDALLEGSSNFIGKPITGVEFNGRTYVFYPYAGPMPAWEHPEYFDGKQVDGILGYIVSSKGVKIHGRFFTEGQYFKFEPSS
jgi:hypothetical protein